MSGPGRQSTIDSLSLSRKHAPFGRYDALGTQENMTDDTGSALGQGATPTEVPE